MGAQCSGFSTSEGRNLEVEPESDGNGVICVKWRSTRCRFQKIMPGDVGIRNDSFTLLTAFACAEALVRGRRGYHEGPAKQGTPMDAYTATGSALDLVISSERTQ